MAMTEITTLPARRDAGRGGIFAEIREFCSGFFTTAFTPYRPEQHYMRGPGPAWRAKHGMVAPIRLNPRGR